ncbi:Histidinol-phosphate aminotransferase [Moraxella lacunata]|uniref:Histidinol-phosphate aminotransferase n=1 Tax=Moraxella lacunata TaxID=477 RepID=A0A378TPY9_MORLA|nr:histidinol-phosphate transaminase [Moraxella lacunata]STZ62925.1 Histidinol-phosphate aminotransferase [Moraxella lacunata]
MQNLINPHIRQLTPYQSARKIGGNGTIWLNANEYPISPNELLNVLTLDNLNRYPEPQPTSIINAYANYAKVNANQVLITRGGDEGIELIIRTFCQNDDCILYCPPTYGMYKVSADTLNIQSKIVPLTNEFGLNLNDIEKNLEKVKVIFICSPNNPTGNLLKREDIISLLTMTKDKAMVVVDEAYIDFCFEQSLANELSNFDNLIIIRTLSKAFALASIRCGFVLANEWVIQSLQKVIAPYPIPTPTALIADIALSDDGIKQMSDKVAITLDNKLWLENELKALPIVKKCYASVANFILVEFKDGQAVFDYLWEKGIIARNQHTALNLTNCIRISIGTMDENKALITALKDM